MGHLDDIGQTYVQHWIFAAQFGLVMILVGLAVIIHAFIPSLFTHTGSQAVKAMAAVLEEDGPL
jgi:hypothetical protein